MMDANKNKEEVRGAGQSPAGAQDGPRGGSGQGVMLKVEFRMAPRWTTLEVYGDTFEVRRQLKQRGYKWNGAYKEWHRRISNEEVEEEINFLKNLAGKLIIYPSGIRGARWLNEHGYKVKNGMVEVRE